MTGLQPPAILRAMERMTQRFKEQTVIFLSLFRFAAVRSSLWSYNKTWRALNFAAEPCPSFNVSVLDKQRAQ